MPRRQQVKILGSLDGVRKRPGMYVGGTSSDGIFNMIFEIVGNSVDQYYARAASEIAVDVTDDGWLAVRDDGPGFPVTWIEPAFTKLSELPTLDGHYPHVHAGGLRGIGLGPVCALSTRLEIETTLDGIRWAQSFEQGKRASRLRRLGRTDVDGTLVRFRPDPTIFTSTRVDVESVRGRLHELAWLLPYLRMFFNGERLVARGGLAGWARQIAGTSKVKAAFGADGIVEDVRVDLGLAWAGRMRPFVYSFANTLPTRTGGKHVEGLWLGLVAYARSVGSELRTLSAVRRALGPGLAATLHVALLHPKFGNPTYDHLESSSAARAVAEVVCSSLANGLPYNDAARTYIHARLHVHRDKESTARLVPAEDARPAQWHVAAMPLRPRKT